MHLQLLNGGRPPVDNVFAERALRADLDSMIRADYREARQSVEAHLDVLRARVLTAIENGQPQSRAVVEHRKAWRASLGLPPLC